MQSNKTVSVIIPTYNRALYIADAVDSVLAQKLPTGWKLEVIIADDGSTDNTAEILRPYIDKKLVSFYSLPHSGKPAVPRNFGINKAKGELIAFQDSDDIWPKDKLIKQIPLFEANKETVMVYGNAEIINSDGIKTSKLVVDTKKLHDGEKFSRLIKNNVISTLTVIVKKEAVLNVGIFSESDELRAVEDYELWLKILSRYPGKIQSINETLAYYRVHEKNISHTNENTEALLRLQSVYYSLFEYDWFDTKDIDIVKNEITKMTLNIDRSRSEKSPKISVVMSVFNGSDFLKNAVQSILDQTYTDFEFIIIDDGSTDDSVKIIKKFKDKRIRLITQHNHGLVFSLNKAISLSRGEYIARQDADDISLPKRLEKEIRWISKDSNRGLVSTYFSLIDYKTSKPTGVSLVFPANHIDLRRAMYITNPFAHGAALFRKKAILENGGYSSDYGPTEDYDMWRKIAEKWTVGLIPDVLFYYRINNPESISQKSNEKQNFYVQKIRDELWQKPFLKKSPPEIVRDYKEIRQYVSKPYANSVELEYKSFQYALTKELLLRGKLKNAINQSIGLLILYPVGFFNVLRFYPKAFKTGILIKINQGK